MKKKIILATTILLLVSGCGELPKLENGQDAVVTFKNGDMISVDDLYQEVKDNFALQTLIDMIDTKMLEKEYKDEVQNAKDYASSTIEGMIEQYGDEETLLQAIQYYTGYATIAAYQESLYLSYLRNLAIEDYAKEQITEKQIKNYYKNDVYGDISINHILITSEAKSDATDEEKEKAENEAKAKVESIIKDLKEAKKNKKDIEKTFGELAKEHSKDDATKDKNGALGLVNYGKLSSDYNNLLDAAYELKVGEFSTKVITTELGYHVILCVEKKEKESLDNVKDSIIETLSQELLNEDASISINALKDLRKKYGVEIQDSEIHTQYANYIQNALASAQSSEE